jgi:hypothetical protein
MADKGTEDKTAAQPAQPAQAAQPGKPAQPGPPGKPSGADPEADLSERPSGGQRFAAAVAATKAKTKQASQAAAAKSAPRGGDGTATAPSTAARPAGRPATKRVRKARLRLTHVDPWSVMKTAFLLSVAVGIVMVVSVAIVWSVLGAAGVWESINSTVSDVVGETSTGFRIEDYLGASRVLGFTMIVAVVDVVLLTVIATLGAFLYNLAAALLGGVEVVLAEDDR